MTTAAVREGDEVLVRWVGEGQPGPALPDVRGSTMLRVRKGRSATPPVSSQALQVGNRVRYGVLAVTGVLAILGCWFTRVLVAAHPEIGPLDVSGWSSSVLAAEPGAVIHLGFEVRNQGALPLVLEDVAAVLAPGSPQGRDVMVLDGVALRESGAGTPATSGDLERYGIDHSGRPRTLRPGERLGGFISIRYVAGSDRSPPSLAAVYHLAVTYRYLGLTFRVVFPQVFAVVPTPATAP